MIDERTGIARSTELDITASSAKPTTKLQPTPDPTELKAKGKLAAAGVA